MKKILSITMALCIAISSLFTGIYAMAEEKPSAVTTKSKTEAQMLGASKYLSKEDTTFTEANAGDFITYIKSGADVSAYKEAFAKSVKKNLDDNNGKIIITKNEYDENFNVTGTISFESASVYGGVIIALNALGYNAASFQGYNIASSYESLDLAKSNDELYHYYLATEGAKAINNNDIAKTLCDSLIKNYYTMDKGAEHWGYSSDNTSMLIIALAPYYNEYKAVVDNALTVLETYKTTGGYFHLQPEAGSAEKPEANCDSTAYALAAYSALGNAEKAKAVYSELCKFESKTTGVFAYEYNGEENAFATKDALFGLSKFSDIVTPCFDGHQYEITVTPVTCTADGCTTHTCKVCGDSYVDTKIASKGHQFGENGYECTVCKAKNPDYKIPKVTGLRTKSYSTNAIRITWDKASGADSYIVYRYNDSLKKYEYIAQVSADASSYKVSHLKAGTIYKFRVAAVKNNEIGEKSNYIKAATRPNQGSVNSVKSPSRKKITVKLNSKACTGYQIQWSTSSDFSTNYKTVTFTSSTTKTLNTAQSKKKYYVRARSFTKVNGVKIYGKWSSTKSVTTK